MNTSIILKPDIELGIVPAHVKFISGVVPDENGKLPRNADGKLLSVAEVERVMNTAKFRLNAVQTFYFPGTANEDSDEVINSFKALGLQVHLVMMIGGANPINPADENTFVKLLLDGLALAKRHDITNVSSTSIEEWMSPNNKTRDGAEFDAAVAQNVQVHTRAYKEADLENSCVKAWHIEFLRPGEFLTFTNLRRLQTFVSAANKALGKPFFKALVDASHCGDSDISLIEDNQAIIAELAANDELGVFHASAKTTRGCLTTDDGWIAALLATAAKSGKLRYVFVEVFHHEDPTLDGLRKLDPGHGIDTTDGRTYTEMVADGLDDVARRLNNLAARGLLKI